MNKRKVLLVGKSARIDCIAAAVNSSRHAPKIYAISEVRNPGLVQKNVEPEVHATEDIPFIKSYASEVRPDFAIIGPEEPLAAGVVDALNQLGIPCIGPSQNAAQIEYSKAFARTLLDKYNIPGNPEHQIFLSLDGIHDYARSLSEFVVKPDALTGGKGVKVTGDHLHSIDEAVRYCKYLFNAGHPRVLIEEKLDGEEFSLQSFCDGHQTSDTPPVQDHKRLKNNDEGPNTGGMGSYTCANHLLPFLTEQELNLASDINNQVAHALKSELGESYLGILYGGFISTANGIRLLEYNARFGDPEVMNVLPLLKNDFVDVCDAILSGEINSLDVSFQEKASVCKYLVPAGYPDSPAKGGLISNVPVSSNELKVYFGAVDLDEMDNTLKLQGSRALAVVGIGDTLWQAEEIAENATCRVNGPLFHRTDIGTQDLVNKRIEHMRSLRTRYLAIA